MIVEGEDVKRLGELPRPERAEMMEVARAEKGEGSKFGSVPHRKGFYFRGRANEAKAARFFANIDRA